MTENAGKKRHGCLTAIIIVFGIFTSLAAVVNLFGSKWIAENLPKAPEWAPTGILVMGLMGVAAVVSLIALWNWKRWGLYLYVFLGLVTLILNFLMGVGAQSILGLVGIALVCIFVLRQWQDFE